MKVDFTVPQKNHPAPPSKKGASTASWNKEITLFQKFSDKKKESFYREFALLIGSGVDFSKALDLLIRQEKKAFIKSILEQISADVTKGKTLFEAFKAQKHFSDYEVFTIKAGEEIRKLPEVLNELQKYFSRKIKVKRQVVSVMAYPSFVLTITFAVLYFMLNYVVPMFASIFKQFGGELPKITQYVIWISSKFNTVFLGVLLIVGLFLILNKVYGANPRFKMMKAKILLRIPIFGKLVKKIAVAKFSQIMGLLLSSRTSLNEALKLSAEVTSFYPLKRVIEDSQTKVTKGLTLHESLNTGFLDDKFLTVVTIGEEVNQLDKMFNELSEQLNEEIDHSTKLIGTVLEPLMIVIIAVIVGFILIAMYYPMFNLSQVLQN